MIALRLHIGLGVKHPLRAEFCNKAKCRVPVNRSSLIILANAPVRIPHGGAPLSRSSQPKFVLRNQLIALKV